MSVFSEPMSYFQAERIGRVPEDVAARWLGQSVFVTEELRWTADLVRLRLKQAMAGLETLVGRVGPSQKTGFWPPTGYDKGFLQSLTDAERQKWYRDQNYVERGLPMQEIGRVEEAMRWPSRYLSGERHDDQRRALQMWCWCRAKRQPFSRFYAALGCSKRVADYRVQAAIDVILEGLVREKVLP